MEAMEEQQTKELLRRLIKIHNVFTSKQTDVIRLNKEDFITLERASLNNNKSQGTSVDEKEDNIIHFYGSWVVLDGDKRTSKEISKAFSKLLRGK